MVCAPAGTRRRVYLPSAPVTVLCPVACTVTDTLLSAEPSPARVTVPVTAPVSWAAAMASGLRLRRKAIVRQRAAGTGNTADEFRRIPVVLMEWTGMGRARGTALR